jgi:hypothetical protein
MRPTQPRAGWSPHELTDSMCPEPTDPAHPYPMRLSHFLVCSVILLKRQPFSGFAQSFRDNIRHLLQCHHPFCYSTQSFFIAIMLGHSSCYITQSFLVAIMLSHFSLLQCSVLPRAMMLNHSSLVQCSIIFYCKRCSAIPRCYSFQSFSTATVLSHSLLLQHAGLQQRSGRVGQLGRGCDDSFGVVHGWACLARSDGWTIGSR